MATTTNFGWETPDDTDLVKDGAAAIRTSLNGVDSSFVDLKGGTTGQVLSKASNTDLDFTWVAQDDSNAIQNAIVDAKGDLIAATAADTPARLAVGTNGQVLTADSSEATGLKWASASAGALTLIATQSLSGVTSQSLNSVFSSTYQNYLIVFSAYAATESIPSMKLRASGTDNSSGYYCSTGMTNWITGASNTAYSNNSTAWDQRPLGLLDTSSGSVAGMAMTLFSPYESKKTAYTGVFMDARIAGNGSGHTAGVHNTATSYDGFTIINSSNMTGTVRVYGLAN